MRAKNILLNSRNNKQTFPLISKDEANRLLWPQVILNFPTKVVDSSNFANFFLNNFDRYLSLWEKCGGKSNSMKAKNYKEHTYIIGN